MDDEIQNHVRSLRNPEASDREKKEAANSLANLAVNDQNKAAIAAAGGIPPLVALVTSGSDSAKEQAARALENLAPNDQNMAAIAAAGGIPPLVALVTSGSDSAKEQAARALANLALNDQNKAAIAAAGGIPPLVALVTSGSDSAKEATCDKRYQRRNATSSCDGCHVLVIRCQVFQSTCSLFLGRIAATCDKRYQRRNATSSCDGCLVLVIQCQVCQSTCSLFLGRIAATCDKRYQRRNATSSCDGCTSSCDGCHVLVIHCQVSQSTCSMFLGRIAATCDKRYQRRNATSSCDGCLVLVIQCQVYQSTCSLFLGRIAATCDKRYQRRNATSSCDGCLVLVIQCQVFQSTCSLFLGRIAQAAGALRNLAMNDQNKAAIAAAGGIPPLVALVTSGSDSAKAQAACALENLAPNDQNMAAIAAAGGIPPLVALVTSGSDSAKEHAAGALRNLAMNDQNMAAIAAAGGIPPLVALVTSGSDSAKEQAARALINLALNDQNKAAIAAAGGIPPLVALVTSGSDSAKEATCDKRYQRRNATSSCDGCHVLVIHCQVSQSTCSMFLGRIAWAAWALGNLAWNDQNRAAIVAAGGVQALQEMVKDGKKVVHRQVAKEALKHFPRESDSAEGGTKLGSDPATKPSTVVSAEKLRGEIRTLESGNEELKAKAAEQLGTAAAVSDENRVAISREGGAEALVALLVTGSDDAKWHAARALRNLANNCEAKEAILKASGIATLEPVVRHAKGKVKEAADEALRLLSQKRETKSIQAATAHGEIAEAGDTIPTGEGTRVAMFSARFDEGPIEQMLSWDVPFSSFISFLFFVVTGCFRYCANLQSHGKYMGSVFPSLVLASRFGACGKLEFMLPECRLSKENPQSVQDSM